MVINFLQINIFIEYSWKSAYAGWQYPWDNHLTSLILWLHIKKWQFIIISSLLSFTMKIASFQTFMYVYRFIYKRASRESGTVYH